MQILPRDIIASLVVLALAMLIHCARRRRSIFSLNSLGTMVFALAMTIVFSLTGISPLSGFHLDLRLDEVALVPFAGIAQLVKNGLDSHAIRNLAGNVLMFAPLGFLLPLLWKRFRHFWKPVVTGFLVSLLIECSQLFLTRGTDVDDLILNTFGAIVGYVCFKLFRLIFPRLADGFALDNESKGIFSMPYLCIIIPYIVIVILGFYDRAMI